MPFTFIQFAGPITNLVVIPQSSLLPRMNHHRATNRVRVSMLDKYPKPVDSSKGVLTFLPSHSSEGGRRIALEFQSTNLLKQQILDLEVSSLTVDFLQNSCIECMTF